MFAPSRIQYRYSNLMCVCVGFGPIIFVYCCTNCNGIHLARAPHVEPFLGVLESNLDGRATRPTRPKKKPTYTTACISNVASVGASVPYAFPIAPI